MERLRAGGEFMRKFTLHVFENEVVVNTSINRSRHSVCDILDMQSRGVPIDVVFSLQTDAAALQLECDNHAKRGLRRSSGLSSSASSTSLCVGGAVVSFKEDKLEHEIACVASLSLTKSPPSIIDELASPRKRSRCT